MSEPIKEFKDAFGHVAYIYKCSKCGRNRQYSRKIHTAPICLECQREQASNYKQNWLYKKAYITAISDLITLLDPEEYSAKDYKNIMASCQELIRRTKDAKEFIFRQKS